MGLGSKPSRLDTATRLANDARFWSVICSLRTGPFRVRVFRGIFSWLGGAEGDEGITVLRRAEGVHSQAGERWRSGGRHLPEGLDQPGDLFQLEEEIRRHAAA